MQSRYTDGDTTAQKATTTAVISRPCIHISCAPPMMVVLAVRPTASSPISGIVFATIRTTQRRERERQRAIERVGGRCGERFATARAPRLRARRQRRDMLEQVAAGAGDRIQRSPAESCSSSKSAQDPL